MAVVLAHLQVQFPEVVHQQKQVKRLKQQKQVIRQADFSFFSPHDDINFFNKINAETLIYTQLIASAIQIISLKKRAVFLWD